MRQLFFTKEIYFAMSKIRRSRSSRVEGQPTVIAPKPSKK
jgi:hypothetical protein